MAVGAGQESRHVVGLGRNVEDLGGHQGPCEIGAQHRHDHTDADEDRSPMPDNGFQHRRHGGLADAGQFVLRHDAVRHQGHQRENAEHTQESDDGGASDVLSLACHPRVDARALDSQEHEHRDQHRARWPGPTSTRTSIVAAPEVVGEDVGLERDDRDHDEHQDRHDLGDGDDVVDDGRILDAAQHEEDEQPHADRRHDHCEHRVTRAESRAPARSVVAVMSTQYEVLPAQADAQYPIAELNPT